ncbi:ATP-dependent helicase [Acidithrix ferrooxidans]|uniref:ATP-dependent DNA helicase UvrD1 n=1 Tax=Acidithrix ferrooxidans TaxID=1280514 RepID=A0A0D8HE96_9ACTN|nr:UvrD-helicase domain-containing protein [Acidithrix ferrooxidans]KJF16258.1 ATP-dependent DNA helicase UvrD1 [Acidithrix ferrooxidans]
MTITNSNNPLLAGLNPAQAAAVSHDGGPLLVIAGAGSGKTRVLTRRIAYLIEAKEVHPGSILAITFTNKAAAEMKERVNELVGPIAKSMWVSTFHSACVRILRNHPEALGYRKNFVIYDQDDAEKLISLISSSMGLDTKRFPTRQSASRISNAKSELLGPKELMAKATHIMERKVAEVYAQYQERLLGANAMDFDDLIYKTHELFERYPAILEQYQRRFFHLLVDEYQDTNVAQNALVMQLGERSRNVFVVGDSDQSVYGFRGADMRNILEFEKAFEDVAVIKLEQNYRSTQTILDVANSIISNNQYREAKNLWTDQGSGEKVRLFVGDDDSEESNFIASSILRERETGGRRYSDFAVFYRINSNSRSVEEAFIRRGIPYRVVGGTRFYDRREIKDTMSYLRLIQNPTDEIALRRVINVPKRGIGDQSIAKVATLAAEMGTTLVDALSKYEAAGVTGRAKSGIADFLVLMEALRGHVRDEMPPGELIEAFLDESGYRSELAANDSVDNLSRLDNLSELVSVASEHETLEAFLDASALVAQADQIQGDDVVTLMTVHTAKGLEYPVVFLTALEDGIFPHSRSLYEPKELEEERRLCYVGVTRAREILYLTRANQRSQYGESSLTIPSRFLDEIPPSLIEDVSVRLSYEERRSRYLGDSVVQSASGLSSSTLKRYGTTSNSTKVDSGPRLSVSQLKPGIPVVHGSWGEGVVTAIDGNGDNASVTIRFSSVGSKKLILSYAPLKLA